MPTSPTVAVITRTKNRQLLLARALKSVQSQSYKEFVQVVVNDGGDKKIVDELVKKYPKDKLLVIHNAKSRGLTAALNQGIKAVKSKYITILDDDDTWSPDRLKLIVDFLDGSESKGVVNVMDRIIEEIREDGTVHEISRNRWHEETKAINLYKQCLDNYLSNGAFTYRREVYDELGGYDETLGVAEDWDFGIRFLMKYDVDFLPTKQALSFYHHRPEQKGDTGNSVFAGVSLHEYQLNMLCNKYLREDLNAGRLGVGYIMNNLRYRREQTEEERGRVAANVVRLEGHMNYVGEDVKDEIRQSTRRIINSDVLRRIAKRFNGRSS